MNELLPSLQTSSVASVFVGLDVHKKTTVMAAYCAGEFVFEKTFQTSDLSAIRKALKKLADRGGLAVCYEACQAGFALHRFITDWGYRSAVIAPSLIPTKPGERKKCDRLDAQKLARYFAHGLLTEVHVPTVDEEAARDLVRLRFTVQKDLLRGRHRLVKFLRKKGRDYLEGENWSKGHRDWIDKIRLPMAYDQEVLLDLKCALDSIEQRLKRLGDRITEISGTAPYQKPVSYLRGLHGIDTLSAMVLVTELGDMKRFKNPRALMAYLGLVPGVHASGETRRGGQSITKTGNRFCRHVLVQASWGYKRPPAMSKRLREQQRDLPTWVKEHSLNAQYRLHKRFWHLETTRSKQVAVVAVARELAGFVGALMLKCQLEDDGIVLELATKTPQMSRRGRPKKADKAVQPQS